ncbi:conjugal transfer protein (plasmid) [Streptomyces sp. NBC_01426]|uniref:conjugal transfer protein n=1 Tax=Streptomyces sp. NBC_01426 TaxID=2975866 RepID=UPI002E36342C|nr:conjugal transfer protein [Streptomyces sp. NBC_01426]
MTPRVHDTTPPHETQEGSTTMKNRLSRTQKILLSVTIVPMLAIGVLGGVGTYSNLSHRYGGETALGALAAGEGATAVMALVLLVTTLFNRPAPLVVRLGLWALPAAAAAMGATAANGIGQTIVYAITPMAITAAAEAIAYLARIVVIHQDGRDIEAETRAAAVIRDLAYHQARATAHPEEKVRARSVKKSWKLAAKVGAGDITLGADLLDVQRGRLSQSADIALERMFTPGLTAPAPALLAVSASPTPAILPAPTSDVMTSRDHESTIHAETSGYPSDTGTDQAGDHQNIRPALSLVRTVAKKSRSMNADVKAMVADGVQDVRYVIDAVATRHRRDPEDKRFIQTVTRYWRDAQADAAEAINEADKPSAYM